MRSCKKALLLFTGILTGLILVSGCVQPAPSNEPIVVNNTSFTNLTIPSGTSASLPQTGQDFGSFIFIYSEPTGASVYLDRADTGRISTGPPPFENISIGSHTVILRLAGYYEAMQQTYAKPKESANVFFFLNRIPEGKIVLHSNPGGAVVYLDDTYTGNVTNETLTGIVPGLHHISLHKDGYAESGKQVMVNAGQIVDISLPLTKIPEAYGNISVSSNPKRLEIYLDGGLTGQMTDSVLNTIPIGLHTITLHHPDFNDVNQQVTVLPNTTSYISIDQQFNTIPYRSIRVESVPPGASVYLDETDTGKITNTEITGISGNKHRIRLHLDGYADVEQGVTVLEDGQGYVYGELRQPLNNTLQVNSSPPGAAVYLNGGYTGKTTNCTINNVFPAGQDIGLHLDGYFDSGAMITAYSNEITNYFASLTKVTTGSVSVTSKPAGARIFLDGVDTGNITNCVLADIPPGSHTFVLMLPGYYPAIQETVVVEGQTDFDYIPLKINPDAENRILPTPTTYETGVSEQIPEHISLEAAFPAAPNTMMVYNVLPEDNVQKFGDLAKEFNVSGDMTMDDYSWTMWEKKVYNEDSNELMFFPKSGSFKYRAHGTSLPDFSGNGINDESARKISDNYLISKGLMPDDAIFDHIAHEQYESGNTTSPEYFDVTYSRKINGITSNDYIFITLTGGGDVRYLEYYWKKIEPYKEMSIISPEDAYNELLETNYTGNITNLSLEYYSGFRDEKSDFILPAYVFRGTRPGWCSPSILEFYVNAVPTLNKSGSIFDRGIYFKCGPH